LFLRWYYCVSWLLFFWRSFGLCLSLSHSDIDSGSLDLALTCCLAQHLASWTHTACTHINLVYCVHALSNVSSVVQMICLLIQRGYYSELRRKCVPAFFKYSRIIFFNDLKSSTVGLTGFSLHRPLVDIKTTADSLPSVLHLLPIYWHHTK